MLWSFLADALVVGHFAFTAFAVLGGFLTWRWRSVAYVHLPALAWGCWIELSGGICPLTPLENELRERAGEAGYQGGFLAHYLHAVLYPVALTRNTQYLLAAILVAINLIAYGGLVLRSTSRREPLP